MSLLYVRGKGASKAQPGARAPRPVVDGLLKARQRRSIARRVILGPGQAGILEPLPLYALDEAGRALQLLLGEYPMIQTLMIGGRIVEAEGRLLKADFDDEYRRYLEEMEESMLRGTFALTWNETINQS